APSALAASASSVTTTTAHTAGQATAALTVSAAMASASADRLAPACAARRDLARASTLTGITRDQARGTELFAGLADLVYHLPAPAVQVADEARLSGPAALPPGRRHDRGRQPHVLRRLGGARPVHP